MRILLVEDDEKTASFIRKGLLQDGHVVEHAVTGTDGLHLALTESYDAAVMDVMLPGMDGMTVVQTLRRKGIALPVVMLSARSSVEDRVKGLQAGGDDYLTKPFAFTELLARLHAIRRRAEQTVEAYVLQVGELRLDTRRRKVYRKEKEIILQPKEFALLEFLMRNEGKVVSKTMIMEQVWDYNFDPQTNVIEARISRLRDKVDQGYSAKYIHTIRGFGYVVEQRP